jgi:hypothetical protein
MDISPKTAMHTVTLNLMQLICGVMLSAAAGGGATYWALTTIDVTCNVPRPDPPQSDEALRRFLEPSEPLPMTGGRRY